MVFAYQICSTDVDYVMCWTFLFIYWWCRKWEVSVILVVLMVNTRISPISCGITMIFHLACTLICCHWIILHWLVKRNCYCLRTNSEDFKVHGTVRPVRRMWRGKVVVKVHASGRSKVARDDHSQLIFISRSSVDLLEKNVHVYCPFMPWCCVHCVYNTIVIHKHMPKDTG